MHLLSHMNRLAKRHIPALIARPIDIPWPTAALPKTNPTGCVKQVVWNHSLVMRIDGDEQL